METKIVQWVQCDDQIKSYNDKMKEKIKPVKEMRDKLSEEILNESDDSADDLTDDLRVRTADDDRSTGDADRGDKV